MGPILFQHFADDLAARLAVTAEMRVLETACGTGILTERLVGRLAGRGTVVATDLNEPMMAYGRRKLSSASRLEWRQADATQLPFEDASFGAVACQFGIMFFPDKAAGIREALRVLKPGGQYLFNVFEALENNPLAQITHETVTSFFASDPPQFMRVPHSLHDAAQVCAWLDAAGFEDAESRPVSMTGVSPSAAEAAIGICEGSPLYTIIMDRRPEALTEIKAALATNLAAQLGDHPLRCHSRALVFSARRP